MSSKPSDIGSRATPRGTARGEKHNRPRGSHGATRGPTLPHRSSVHSETRSPAGALALLFGALLLGFSTTLLRAAPAQDAAPPGTSTLFNPTKLAWQAAVVLGLIFVNAFFALAEYALVTVRDTRIRQLVEEGNRSAVLVEQMKEHPTRMQATIQTGLTLVATLSSAIAATSAVGPLTFWLQNHTSGFLQNSASTLALLLVTLPVAVLSLVIGEIAPKSLAMRHPDRLALIAVHPIRWLQVFLAPAVATLTFLSNLVLRPFGGTATFTAPVVNEHELKMMVEASEEQGVLEREETQMIHSVLDFGDTVVRKVMTPRIDITALPAGSTVGELAHIVRESGHSRIPVYDGDLDNIVGIVHAKDLLGLPADLGIERAALRSVMRAPYFIPELKKVDELLTEFRRSKQQLAIVRDEYGVTSGVVTIEDLLEEIVGEIQDEYDREEPMVHVLDRTTTLLDGRMALGDVNDRMGLDLPEDRSDTIGGFVFDLLGHQAVQGEHSRWNGIDFTVDATDGRRITRVRVCQRPEDLPSPDGRLNGAEPHQAPADSGSVEAVP